MKQRPRTPVGAPAAYEACGIMAFVCKHAVVIHMMDASVGLSFMVLFHGRSVALQ
jgi:hypothetical protein